MKTCVALLATLITALALTTASAQTLPTAKPDDVGMSSQRLERVGQVVKSQIEKGRFPGAVVVIARKGKIAYFETFGQRDPGATVKMTKDAIFRLYSMTKPFTSVAAMMLVEDGKMTLADPVSKYLPQLADLKVAVGDTLVPLERPITVQDLLRHTSGIVYSNNTLNP